MMEGVAGAPVSSTRRGKIADVAGLALTVCLTACAAGAPQPAAQNAPPRIAAIRDGIAADLDSQDARTSLFANWDDFVDPEGGPVIYEWAVGTNPGATDLQDWSNVGGATRGITERAELPVGGTVYVSVRAIDLQGNRSQVASSDGIVIGQPEAAPSVRPGQTPPPVKTGFQAAVDHHGITWTFDRPTQAGRFVNGDWWVVGPVHVVAITPISALDGGRVRNGAMINPDPKVLQQGYDSTMYGEAAAGRYEPALNVAFDLSRQRPLQLQPGQSLVSTVSVPLAGQMPQLERCAVLTCLDAAPPADAFRPPYCGSDKSCRWFAGKLDLTRLARLEPAAGAPLVSDLVERFEHTWLDHVPGWTGRYLHPTQNMPDYGRELSDLVGVGALMLQIDLPPQEKRQLAIAMVQLGIDLHGVVQNGGRFLADGGSGSGRKFPVLLAGALLQDQDLLRSAREPRFTFAEDAQTFYVAETAPGVCNGGHGGYGPEDVGLPEWGNRHADDPSLDAKSWTGDPYRRCCTANVWAGFVLATRIMGLRDEWAHPALFDYVDRYLQIEPRGAWTRAWTPFVERMWDRYRAQF